MVSVFLTPIETSVSVVEVLPEVVDPETEASPPHPSFKKLALMQHFNEYTLNENVRIAAQQ